MSRHILSIDQGTTGTTVLVLNESLAVLAKVNREFPQIYPRPGWVEHNPEAIWDSVQATIEGAMKRAGISPSSVAGI